MYLKQLSGNSLKPIKTSLTTWLYYIMFESGCTVSLFKDLRSLNRETVLKVLKISFTQRSKLMIVDEEALQRTNKEEI